MDPALLTPDLLAPGDGKSAALDPAQFAWSQIRTPDDPLFETAYAALWQEFGAAHEMETRDVLAARLRETDPLRYEILLVHAGTQVAAVRDHTAIACDGEIIVHLSHLLVAPDWRRSGLAGWMRAAPFLTARELAAAHGTPGCDVTLVGEMEYVDGSNPRRALRLRERDIRHLRNQGGDEREFPHRHDVLANRRGEIRMMECGEHGSRSVGLQTCACLRVRRQPGAAQESYATDVGATSAISVLSFGM